MDNWDLHKENVQPLSQGRRVSDLGRMLAQTPGSDETKKREETRREFEDLLRCDSEDKLAIWSDYINWVEQNYPEGGEEANLKKLIENCISDLFNNTNYHQDERFFRIFLRYTRIVNDALELFNIMFNSGIFTSIAAFYINWANVVEKNLSKAEEIIRMGLERLAQPTIQLELALKEVQLIAAENMGNEPAEEEEDVRKPFVPLKVEKKKSGKTLAPVERLGNYDSNGYKLASNQAAARTANSQLQIFSDENGDAAMANQQEIVKKLPTNNQENQGKAGRWCDNKIKSKPRIEQPAAVKFEVYERPADEAQADDEQAGSQPMQTGTQANAKLKEVKKEEKSPRLVIFEKLAPNQRFYCDLKKIYCGGTEYSFEEIRSIRLKLAKKKNEDRSSKEKMMREIEDLRRQISERDNMYNDVEQMKKKLEDLLKANSKTKVADAATIGGANRSNGGAQANGGDKRKSPDPIEQHERECTGEKQRKFDPNLLHVPNRSRHPVSKSDDELTAPVTSPATNCPKVINRPKDADMDELKSDEFGFKSTGIPASGNGVHFHTNQPPQFAMQHSASTQQQQQFSNSPQHRADRKEDLTVVRDLWNGSIEEIEQTVEIEGEFINRPPPGDFTIFKDDEDVKANRNYEDTNTIALPQGDYDFQAAARLASTPAGHLLQGDTSLDENCTINVFHRDNNRFLSPIVETSREYKSHSSSSSLSGFTSYQKSRTFHK